MIGNYVIKQNRELYQLFPNDKGNAAYAIRIPQKHSIDNSEKVWNRCMEYYSNGKITSIGDMIEQGMDYEEIIQNLDL